MRLNNREFYDYLIEQGTTSLYHANTVSTAVTYIQQRGLLSRGAVQARDLYQTPQDSDQIDQEVDVWSDMFFDSLDLHGYFPRQNTYGPVSFKYSTDLVLNESLHFWVTKNNPQYWNADTPMADRYFQSINELRANGDQIITYRKMITIKNYNEPLGFEHLEKINIDNPNVLIFNDVNPVTEYAAQFKAIQPFELLGKFRVRAHGTDCSRFCYCTDNYLRFPSRKLAKLFLSHDHPRFNG